MMQEDPALANVEQLLPLTPTQTGMLAEILTRDAAAYRSVLCAEISGPVTAEAIASIFAEEAMRHQASRVSIVHEGMSQPVQVVHRNVLLDVPVREVTGDVKAVIADRVAAFEAAEMPLAKAPLMTAEVLRLEPDRAAIIWSVHHMVSDGWSARVVLNDVVSRLSGGSASAGSDWAPHVAAHQTRDTAADQDFWRARFAGFEAPTCLAPDGLRRRADRHLFVTLPEHQTQALADMARTARVTLATALAAGWALTLRHLTGQDDVAFGAVQSGRDPAVPGIDRAVGPYLTTQPTRFRIVPETPLRDQLAAWETAAREAQARPLSGLADLPREGRVWPLFDTLFAWEGFAEQGSSEAVRLTDVTVRDATSFPLAVLATPGTALRLELVFDGDTFAEETVDGIGAAYLDILRAMATYPDAVVQALLPNPPVPEPPQGLTPVSLAIHQMAKRVPDRIAVTDGAGRLNYAALDHQALSIAGNLHAAGIGRGDVVPVALPRGPEAVAALLGVLYAGAAYVPLDLSYPDARNTAIAAQLDAKGILAEQDCFGLATIPYDTNTALPSPVVPDPDHPAYLIFTSGSTGAPKGVVICHRNLSWSNHARQGVYGDGPKGFLHLSSLAFDSSVVGLYWPLLSGGRVILAPPRAEQDPAGLARLGEAEGADYLLALPRLWSALLEAGGIPGLKTVIVAGEDVPRDLPLRHRGIVPDVRLFNEYGPTEGTVWCAAAEITQHDDGPVPIGTPPEGASLRVADRDGNSLPPGIIGELVLSGSGLAQSYWRNSMASEAAFGAGFYRTGDLGVADGSGVLTCLGRADDQVKLRGHRIELAEIENAALAAGASAAVAAATGDQVILAVTGLPDGLADALSATLPPAAVPAAIHDLPELPSLPNGKMDRAAVAGLGLADAVRGESGEPREGTETRVASVYRTCLGIEPHRDTDFFAAGGDSLMTIRAMQVASSVGLSFRPDDLFQTSVVKDLAAVLDARQRAPQPVPDDAQMSVSHADGTRVPVFMFHGSAGIQASLAAALGPDRPLYYQYSHHLGGALLLTDRIENLVAQSVERIRKMQPDGPYALAGFSLGGIMALEAAHQLQTSGADVSMLAMIDPTQAVFPPKGHALSRRETLDISARAGASLLKVAWQKLRRADRTLGVDRLAVTHTYRAILSRYRLPVWDGPVLLLQSMDSCSGSSVFDAALPHATKRRIKGGHFDIQDTPAVRAEWTAELAAYLHEREGTRK